MSLHLVGAPLVGAHNLTSPNVKVILKSTINTHPFPRVAFYATSLQLIRVTI